MSPTPLTRSVRHVHDGETRVYWVVTIADATDASRTELDAGVDLTGEVAQMVGWHVRSEVRDVQVYGQKFATRLYGSLEVDDSRIIFYADRTGVDVRQAFSRGLTGHVVVLHGGDVDGNPMDVWPVQVAALGVSVPVGGPAAMIDVQFVVTDDPALGGSVPGES